MTLHELQVTITVHRWRIVDQQLTVDSHDSRGSSRSINVWLFATLTIFVSFLQVVSLSVGLATTFGAKVFTVKLALYAISSDRHVAIIVLWKGPHIHGRLKCWKSDPPLYWFTPVNILRFNQLQWKHGFYIWRCSHSYQIWLVFPFCESDFMTRDS
jgi:hypothetical protein